MYPIQPYFALSTSRYFKRPVESAGIAHIYEYVPERSLTGETVVVPDGSLDLLIDEDRPEETSYIAGSVLKGTRIASDVGHHYFGVRFMPGFVPSFLNGSMNDFVGNTVDIGLCSDVSESLIDGLIKPSSFREKADFFLSFYNGILKNDESGLFDPKLALTLAIRDMIEREAGNIRVSEIAAATGYSERYVNKVFKEMTGMTPKFFCRIMRFQSTIDHLDHDSEIAMTELALNHGYYDQSQFIKEFREFTLLSPNKYRKAIKESSYGRQFILE